MEVVRESLDNCVDEKGLVDDILSYIYPNPEHYVYICEECGVLDKINYQNNKCDICTNKALIPAEFDRITSGYAFTYVKCFSFRYKNFSNKLHEYFDKIVRRIFIEDDGDMEDYRHPN